MRLPFSGLKKDNPAFPLLMSGISFWGITDNNGAGTGLTIRCGALALEPPYDNHKLKLLTGPSAGQCRDITLHPAGTDTLTVSAAFTNVTGAPQQINAGTLFVVMSDTPSAGGAAPTLHASGTQLAIIGTEHIVATAAVAGKFTFHVDTLNMAAGDVLELRVYEKVLTGGSTTGVLYYESYSGVQLADDRIKVSEIAHNELAEANALQFTLLQRYGVGCNFAWKVVRE